MKTCRKLFIETEKRKPKGQRRKCPEEPKCLGGAAGSEFDADAYNDEAFNAYKKGLVPCPTCARTFNPDSLKVHARVCGKGNFKNPKRVGSPVRSRHQSGVSNPASEEKKTEETENQLQPRPLKRLPSRSKSRGRLVTLTCYICGSQYSQNSLEVHLKSC